MIRLSLNEHQEQVNLVRWLELKGIGFFAVPNGGERKMSTAINLKREGVREGAPDLVLTDFAPFIGKPVAIEMKRKVKAKYSPAQLEMHERMRAQGWVIIAPPSGQSAQYVIQELQKLGFGGQRQDTCRI